MRLKVRRSSTSRTLSILTVFVLLAASAGIIALEGQRLLTTQPVSSASSSSSALAGYQDFERRILIRPPDSFVLHDNLVSILQVNQTEVGSVLDVGWNSGIICRLVLCVEEIRPEPMIVSLKEGNVTLVNGTGSSPLSPAWLTAANSNNKVIQIGLVVNGDYPRIAPKNATLVGDKVQLGSESSRYPQFKSLRVLLNTATGTGSYFGPSSDYQALIFNGSAILWTYTLSHAGTYTIAYRFTRSIWKDALSIHTPMLAGMIHVSLNKNGKEILENFSAIEPNEDLITPFVYGQQYILFPKATASVRFYVTWNSSSTIDTWISEDTQNGTFISFIGGPTGSSGTFTIDSSVAVYWLNFRGKPSDFVDGGYIRFDMKYPSGVNVVTYFKEENSTWR